MSIWLIAVMLWHDGGDNYIRRHAIVPIPSAAECEQIADSLRIEWRKDNPAATISIECVPVIRMVKA